jgi:hypothetical protein
MEVTLCNMTMKWIENCGAKKTRIGFYGIVENLVKMKYFNSHTCKEKSAVLAIVTVAF